MSDAVKLSLSVDADTSKAVNAFDDVGAAAKGMADDVDRAAKDADSGMSGFGDSAENAGSSAATAAGAFGDLGGALAMMPGPLGALGTGMETVAPAIQGVTGATDLLGLAMNSNIVVTAKNTAATIASKTAQIAASAASKAMAAAQWLLNAALSANPIGIVVIALIALVAALVIAYKKSETFRNIVQAAMRAVGTAVTVVANVVKTAFKVAFALVTTYLNLYKTAALLAFDLVKAAVGKVKDAINAVVGAIKDVIGWFKKLEVPQAVKDLAHPFDVAKDAIDAVSTAIDKLIGWIGKIHFPSIPKAITDLIPGRSVSGVPGGTSSRALGATAGAGGGGGVVIHIHGAIDPYTTAQQIKRVLARGALIAGRA